jgi:rhodanese-related sulfurtransferase
MSAMRYFLTMLAFWAFICNLSLAADGATSPTTQPVTVVNVNPDEFEKVIAKDHVVVLDVRTPAEFKAGHLAHAVNIDVKDAKFADQVMKLSKDKAYTVYCATGRRSVAACEIMHKSEFTRLYNLVGGIKAWTDAGKAVVTDTTKP